MEENPSEGGRDRMPAQEGLRESEARFRQPAGGFRRLWAKGLAVGDDQGRCGHLAVLIRDITERKRTTRELHRNRRQLKQRLDELTALREREQQQTHDLERRVAARTAELSAAVERLQHEVAERQRAEGELARAHRFVSAMNRVASRIQSQLDTQAVLDTLGTVIAAEGLTCLVLQWDDEARGLSVRHTSLAPEALAAFEVLGFPLLGTPFPGDAGPLADLLARGQVRFVPDQRAVMAAAAGERSPRDLELALGLLQLDVAHPALYLPLVAEEQQLAVLVVWGADLQEGDLPAFSVLAQQVSNALERLRLSRQAAEVEILREVDRLRSELVANVSHEIRTPLGLISVLSSSLLMDDVAFGPEVQREFLLGIQQATDRLTGIVENLLDLGRLDGGRLVLARRPVDLVELASTVAPGLVANGVGHTLVLDVEGGEVVAWADRGQMERVLANLVSNAVKYSPAGGTIRIAGQKDGDRVVLSVSDEGIGIPEEEQEKVFERFYRVDSEWTHRLPGVGLGLAVCRGIVTAHGGWMWVESRPGLGSTFYVSLPAPAA